MGNVNINVTQIRDNFAEILGRIRFGGEIVTVEKKGKPYAVIISPAQYDTLQKAARKQFGAILQKVHARNADVSPEEVARDIAEEIEAVRRKGYEREE
jgi:prevent-host-death family protein